jgi:hypothetical protein
MAYSFAYPHPTPSKPTQTLTRQAAPKSTGGFCVVFVFFWAQISFLGPPTNNGQSPAPALNSNTAELIWLQSMLRDLGFYLPSPPTLWCDNIRATYFFANPAFHARTKHIEIDFHFVRDKVASKTLIVRFISNKDNLADIFTKPIASSYVTCLHPEKE